jgi:hypothetical protein
MNNMHGSKLYELTMIHMDIEFFLLFFFMKKGNGVRNILLTNVEESP